MKRKTTQIFDHIFKLCCVDENYINNVEMCYIEGSEDFLFLWRPNDSTY